MPRMRNTVIPAAGGWLWCYLAVPGRAGAAAVLYSTVQYSTVLYNTVQYSTVLYCTILYSTYLDRLNLGCFHNYRNTLIFSVIFKILDNPLLSTFFG